MPSTTQFRPKRKVLCFFDDNTALRNSGRAEKRGYQGSSLSCPHCRESARFVEYRPKTVQSLVGAFALERAYYHCRSCGAGAVPWDDALGLSRQALTPGAREVVALAGAV